MANQIEQTLYQVVMILILIYIWFVVDAIIKKHAEVVKRLEASVQDKIDRLEGARECADHAEDRVVFLEKKIKDLEEEVQDKCDRLEGASEGLDHAWARNKRLEEKLKQVEAERNEYEKNIEAYEAKITDLRLWSQFGGEDEDEEEEEEEEEGSPH